MKSYQMTEKKDSFKYLLLPLSIAILSIIAITVVNYVFYKDKFHAQSPTFLSLENAMNKESVDLKKLNQKINEMLTEESAENNIDLLLSSIQSTFGILEIALIFLAFGGTVFFLVISFFFHNKFDELMTEKETLSEMVKKIKSENENLISNHQAEFIMKAKGIDVQIESLKTRYDEHKKYILMQFYNVNPTHIELNQESIKKDILAEINERKTEDSHELKFQLGVLYYLEKNYLEASKEIIEANRLKPSKYHYLFYLGLIYDDWFSGEIFEKGENDVIDGEIIKKANRALENYNLAAASSEASVRQKALSLSNKAFTHLEIGKYYEKFVMNTDRDKQYELALSEFNESIKLNSGNVEEDPYCYFGKAITLYRKNKIEDAKVEFMNAERIEYSNSTSEHHKQYSKLQFRFMREEIYKLFK